MQVQNFECQIAKAQIGRFVAGDKLSDEALQQLEAHISKCPACQVSLAERRAALQSMLAPQETESDPQPKLGVVEFIKSKTKSGQPVQAAVQAVAPKASSFTKPAIYSLALAAVLIAMSYMSRNMDSVFGPKAATLTNPGTQATTDTPPTSYYVIQAQPAPAKIAKATSTKPQTPAPPKTPPVAPKAKPATPKQHSSAAPKPEHRVHKHRGGRGAGHDSNTVRVYDPEN